MAIPDPDLAPPALSTAALATVSGHSTPHLLHFGHIPDKGFIIHIGEQFAQLVQV